MPKRPVFNPLLTPDGWMVSIPASMSGTGKRQKRHFELEKDAEKFAASLRTQYHAGLRGGTISPELAASACAAMAILSPLGITLLEAAKMLEKQHRPIGSTETFRTRWKRYQLAQAEHWGKVYTGQVKRMENWLSKRFMDSAVGTITTDVIAAELERYASTTRKLYTTMVNGVLSERGKKKRAKNIEILHHFGCKRLLAATRRSPEEFRVIALLLFAGIRPGAEEGEISRMDWSAIGKKEIYLPPEITKTGSDRHIPITPMLRQLLKGHPASGSVIPRGWKRQWTRIRAAARISEKTDICRHTFGSHFLAAFGEDAAKMAMGHTRDSDTLFRHYRRSVTRENGLKYFGLAEEPVKKKPKRRGP